MQIRVTHINFCLCEQKINTDKLSTGTLKNYLWTSYFETDTEAFKAISK